ncbi:MAG: adenylate/guanylate cyclase domain-containing protein [Chloroflexota bacterium]|nr:adenylate/guanylate cyclase domain-containing protein [Chloroflexota bacterium]
MPPQIRYAKTSDGVNIAYYAIGSGQPIVYVPPMPMTHVELEWRVDDLRAAYERTARNNTWVRYDGRGFGLSDRDATDFSLDAMVRDLGAVVDALELSSAVFMATASNSVTALAYASLHPERVAALVLWEGVARGPDGQDESFFRLAHTNLPLLKQLLAGACGFANESATREMELLMDEAVTQDNCIAFYDAVATWDVTDRLPSVTAPTLVLHRRGIRWISSEACRRLAAALPNSTFTTVEGSAFAFTDPASSEAIGSFLSAHFPRPAASERSRTEGTGGVRIILFTDIVSSTALTEHMGDAAFRDASRALDSQLRAAMREAGGLPVEGKVLGDGVMGTFASAREAITAALRCSALSAASELELHIGLHAGDVIHEGNNVYGGTVNIASRICQLSAPGEILVSDVVRGMARSSAGVEFADRGEQEMKGVGEPVRVYAVRTEGA